MNFFVSRLSRKMQKHIESIPKEAMEALTNAPWPGNIRELENFIERAVILTQGSELRVPLKELKRPSVASTHPPRPFRKQSARRSWRRSKPHRGKSRDKAAQRSAWDLNAQRCRTKCASSELHVNPQAEATPSDHIAAPALS